MDKVLEGPDLKEHIGLSFTEDSKYKVEFSPVSFWKEFAEGYGALSWEELNDERLAIVAVNYTYLVNLLVLAREYYLKKQT